MADMPAQEGSVSAAVGSGTPDERRDIQLAIEHWQRNTWGPDSIPLLDTFDFAPLRERWGHWFLICGNHSIESAVFVSYGAGFAQLLGLAHEPVTDLPCIEQVPVPYRAMFSAGYNRAGSASSPVTSGGRPSRTDRTKSAIWSLASSRSNAERSSTQTTLSFASTARRHRFQPRDFS